MTLHFYLLGTPQFHQGDIPITLKPAKAIALLAYLAGHDSPQARESLIGLLWPESSSATASKNMRNVLWAIRQAFGKEVLVVEQGYLSLNPAVWVDLHHFTPQVRQTNPLPQLTEAVELYRDTFLAGLDLRDAPEFDTWLTLQREHLRQQFLRQITQTMSLHAKVAAWPAVLTLSQRALNQDDLQEGVVQMSMRALTHLGKRSQALQQYQALSERLNQTLGVAPLPETETLYNEILQGALQPTYQPPPLAHQAPSNEKIFVGRQHELHQLDATWHAVLTGRFQVALLSGEMGIGKTTLWQQWVTHHRETQPLTVRGLDTTQNLPLAPIVAMLNGLAQQEPLFSKISPVSPMWLTELSRLLPQIRLHQPDLPAPIDLPAEDAQQRLFEALVQAILALAGTPPLLFVDDLHWLDQTTLDWLTYLTHRIQTQPFLLVTAYRHNEISARMAELLTQWQRSGVAHRLPLHRLSPTESQTLITNLAGDGTIIDHLQQQSAGNPLYLTELSRVPFGDIPPLLADVTQARLNHVPAMALQVLQAAAILEPDVDFQTLQETSGRSELETLDGFDILRELNLMEEQGQTFAFSHPFIATFIREQLSGPRRTLLHRRAAVALEKHHAPHLATVAGRLTYHYQAAGQAQQAADCADLAADYALSVAAPTEAIRFYQHAISLADTPVRQLRLAQAFQRHGQLAQARQHFQHALTAYQTQQDKHGQLVAYLQLADTYFPGGEPIASQPWLKQALQLFDEVDVPTQRAFAYLLQGGLQLRASESLVGAIEHFERASELALQQRAFDIAARSKFEMGNLLGQLDRLSGALQAFDEAIQLAQQANDQYMEILSLNNGAYHALLAQDRALALRYINTALELSDQRGLHLPDQYLYSTRGEVALAYEEWDEGETWFKRGAKIAESRHNQEMMLTYQANLALIAQGRGDLAQALQTLTTVQTAVSDLRLPHLRDEITLRLVELHRQRGEDDLARQQLQQVDLEGSERKRLQRWAIRLRDELV